MKSELWVWTNKKLDEKHSESKHIHRYIRLSLVRLKCLSLKPINLVKYKKMHKQISSEAVNEDECIVSKFLIAT